MNQSELETKACNRCRARENSDQRKAPSAENKIPRPVAGKGETGAERAKIATSAGRQVRKIGTSASYQSTRMRLGTSTTFKFQISHSPS